MHVINSLLHIYVACVNLTKPWNTAEKILINCCLKLLSSLYMLVIYLLFFLLYKQMLK